MSLHGLQTSDWFLYDTEKRTIARFNNGDIIAYGDFREAFKDRYENEKPVAFNKLPLIFRIEYMKQLKKY